MHQPIIPGLPDDLALRCLAMLSHGHHGVMEAVSKRWRDVMRSEEYASYKARQGWSGDWLFVLAERAPNQWRAYDPEADRWHPLPPTPTPDLLLDGTVTLVLGCHCVHNKFLVIRGIYQKLELHPDEFISNEMLQFDPFKKEWSRVTSMRTSRSNVFFASCAMDGKVYVAGGSNPEYPNLYGMNLAEVYDPLADKWEDLPLMPVPMTSCCGIAYKGKFHVINHWADNREGVRHQVQVFDPSSRTWHVKRENWYPSSDQEVVVDDQVYFKDAFGGTLERRDAEKDEWHIVGEVPPLYHPDNPAVHASLYYGLASLGHKLYVVEGIADLGRVRACDPRCSPLIWRETRPMFPNASGYIEGWASLKQQ